MKIPILTVIIFLSFSLSAQITTNSEWTWMNGDSTANTPGTYNKPGDRFYSSKWTDANKNFWLFGGYGVISYAGYLNDLWKYNPSTNTWTFIRGSYNYVNQTGTYGTKGVPAYNNYPGGRENSSAWTDYEGNMWLFGGDGYDSTGNPHGLLNDLWVYNPVSNKWTWMKGSNRQYGSAAYGNLGVATISNTPGGRDYGNTWTDLSGNLWLFGGEGIASNASFGELNDLWKYDIASNQWTWIKGDSTAKKSGIYGVKGVASPANNPGSRISGTSWIDNAGDLWLFGGSPTAIYTNQYYNDLWKYNIATNQWTWVSGDSLFSVYGIYGNKGIPDDANKPGARFECASWKDNAGNLWLFGGVGFEASGNSGSMNDLWKYNISTNQWTWEKGDTLHIGLMSVYGIKGIADSTNKPGYRQKPSAWTDGNNFWMFGGSGSTATAFGFLNDLWKLGDANINICPPTGNTTFTSSIPGNTYQWQLSINGGVSYSSISDNSYYSGTTTITLSLNNIPSSWYGYKYRCVVNGNNCDVYTIKFIDTWTGAVSSIWSNPANWSCGAVPDGYTDVYINANAVVVINANTTIGTLNISPGASITINPLYTLTLLGH